MEQVIGILDGQAEYAGKLTGYINEKKEIGCFAVSFRDEEELLHFCERKKLSALLIGGKTSGELQKLKENLPVGLRCWVLSGNETEREKEGVLFRYQKAGNIIRFVLDEMLSESSVKMSELLTVFSPESNAMAAEYAMAQAEQLAKSGRTLFVAWDAFLGYGRQEEKETELPSLSELLYYVRKDLNQAKKLFAGIRKKGGVEAFCGPDYSTDLWQYSPQEMQQLLLCCREYGNYRHIVFLAGVFHEGTAAVMRQSSRVCLVCSKSEAGNKRTKEFFRQMKYAGEQEILTKVEDVVEV